MKILSIGNSFSQDAHRYLHEIAKHDGVDIFTTNLNIGGCPLESHYKNIVEDNESYDLEINGGCASRRISIKSALLSDEWDYVTLQQASDKSWDYATYNPYLKEIFDYVKKLCPKAKILLQQTWFYEENSERLFNITPFKTSEEMFLAIEKSYNNCLRDLPFDGIIPSGKTMLQALKLGIGKIHRDTFHASLGVGRYLIGLVWYKYLTDKDITTNTFDSLDEPITNEQREIVIKAVNTILNK